MEAYLDNSATTRCFEEVRDIVVKTMMEDYGNPSAMHKKGVEAEQYVKDATEKIAKTLKVQEKVKAAIENMTGLTVADVNIRVAGVDMPEEE